MAVREAGTRQSAVLASMEGLQDKRAGLIDVSRAIHQIPRPAAVIRVDLWGEVTRNPVMADLLRPVHESGRAGFVETFKSLATRGPAIQALCIAQWTSCFQEQSFSAPRRPITIPRRSRRSPTVSSTRASPVVCGTGGQEGKAETMKYVFTAAAVLVVMGQVSSRSPALAE